MCVCVRERTQSVCLCVSSLRCAALCLLITSLHSVKPHKVEIKKQRWQINPTTSSHTDALPQITPGERAHNSPLNPAHTTEGGAAARMLFMHNLHVSDWWNKKSLKMKRGRKVDLTRWHFKRKREGIWPMCVFSIWK